VDLEEQNNWQKEATSALVIADEEKKQKSCFGCQIPMLTRSSQAQRRHRENRPVGKGGPQTSLGYGAVVDESFACR
jgi:hypothetical protein